MDCEKVFLDYGVQWEEAWREHVENWDPPIDDDYTPIKEMKNLDFFRTIEELEDQPYDNLDETGEIDEKWVVGTWIHFLRFCNIAFLMVNFE